MQIKDLTQTISSIVGILLSLVAVGFFVYLAYRYLTASGAPHQMEPGRSAMMTAIVDIILAPVGYGVVDLLMGAVGPGHRLKGTRMWLQV